MSSGSGTIDSLCLDERLAVDVLDPAADKRLAALLLLQFGSDDQVLVREGRLLVLEVQSRGDADVGREV